MAEMTTPEHLRNLSENLSETARKGNLNQSILLVGKEGSGKFALLMDLAMTLLCENDRSGCGECSSCRQVARLRHPDFLLLFPFPNIRPESKKQTVFHFSDPVSSSARFSEETRDTVEEFRQKKLSDPFYLPNYEKREIIPVEVVKDLIGSLAKKPLEGGRRVVGVLNIEKMAFGAADLFLKTVEEPPQNTHLILATARPDLLYSTLLSRTQRIKVPPMPEEAVFIMLKERLGQDDETTTYLARLGGGSPGLAVCLYENELLERREKVLAIFLKLLAGNPIGEIIGDIESQYGGFKSKYDDIKFDFQIIETIIHDLYFVGENDLDNHLINFDIRVKFRKIKPPAREVLDIWNDCCAETRRACGVNNVAADAGMMFFYISCAEAMAGGARPKYTLP
jgi:DNA polymerase III delta prime subunit